MPRTLCSVKSFSDVEYWPEAKLGQVHSNKFQRRLALGEECQSCLQMMGCSVVSVFLNKLSGFVLNCDFFKKKLVNTNKSIFMYVNEVVECI